MASAIDNSTTIAEPPTHSSYNNIKNNHNTSMSDFTNKWVVKLSNTPLTKAQTSLLARGPKFTIVPQHPPMGHYVSAVEKVCHLFPPRVAGEVRADTSKLLDRTHPQTQHHHTRSQGH